MQPLALGVFEVVAVAHANATKPMKPLLVRETVDPRYDTECHASFSFLIHTWGVLPLTARMNSLSIAATGTIS